MRTLGSERGNRGRSPETRHLAVPPQTIVFDAVDRRFTVCTTHRKGRELALSQLVPSWAGVTGLPATSHGRHPGQ